MTVTGPVDSGDLGIVLPHEHVFIDLVREYRGSGLLNDEHLARAELGALRAAGGGTLVDLTVDEIGRDPDALRRVSVATGISIVMGCGHYRDPYLDRAWFDRTGVDAIAAEIVRDITEGVRDTGVRAGIIGEIGADRHYVSAAEERSFRAAARAHRLTGLTISTHAARWPVGLAQLELLTQEGVDPRRVIVGHTDSVPIPDYHLALQAGLLRLLRLDRHRFLLRPGEGGRLWAGAGASRVRPAIADLPGRVPARSPERGRRLRLRAPDHRVSAAADRRRARRRGGQAIRHRESQGGAHRPAVSRPVMLRPNVLARL